VRLTKASVAKLVLPHGKKDHLEFDDALAGFGVRIRSGGKRTWIAQYRIGAKQRRLSLGSVETVDADEARRRAKAARIEGAAGNRSANRKDRLAAKKASVILKDTAESYLSRFAEKRLRPSSLEAVRRHLRTHWSPLHEVGLHAVTKQAVGVPAGGNCRNSRPLFCQSRPGHSLGFFFLGHR